MLRDSARQDGLIAIHGNWSRFPRQNDGVLHEYQALSTTIHLSLARWGPHC